MSKAALLAAIVQTSLHSTLPREFLRYHYFELVLVLMRVPAVFSSI